MKKIKGTKYARVGASYTPLLDAEIAKVEGAVLNRQARLHEIALRAARAGERKLTR